MIVKVSSSGVERPFRVNFENLHQGPRGAAGFTPTILIEQITGGHQVTVIGAEGEETFNIMDGVSVTSVQQNDDYTLTLYFSDGNSWTTPTPVRGQTGPGASVTVTDITRGHQVDISDTTGSHTFNVMDGNGISGAALNNDYTLTLTFNDGNSWTTPIAIRGETGFAPTVAVTSIEGGKQVTITDAVGDHTFTILDGAKGDTGNGISSIEQLSRTDDTITYRINMTNNSHTDFTVYDGLVYKNATQAIYNSARELLLSAVTTVQDLTSTSITLSAEGDTRYIYGELTALNITSLPQTGIADIFFVSGSTETVVTLPQGTKMPEWYLIAPNTAYELSFVNGYGTVMSWPNT